MSQNDDSEGKKRKNPWGNVQGDDRGAKKGGQSPWGTPPGSGGNNRGDNEPPDFDDLLRGAQDALREILPANINPVTAGGLLILAILLLWLSSGLHIINPGEHGVIQRFGAWSRTQVAEGLGYHFPAPIEKITKVNVSELRRMEIGFSEGVVLNQSPILKMDNQDESLMLTSDRNIVDLHIVIQWDIKSAEDYLFKVQDQENTIKRVAESAIREIVGQKKMFSVITTERAAIAGKVKDIIQKNLDEYSSGVNVKQVLIQKAEVHPDVQKAFQDVQSAKQDAEDIQNQAQAYREDILPKARGEAIKIKQQAEAYKQSQVAKATGDAERFKSVYNAYLGGKDVTKERMYIETMEEVLSNAQKIILDNKDGQSVVPYLPLNELNKQKQ